MTAAVIAAAYNLPPVMLGADGLHPNDAGMTYLAGQYATALAAAGKTPAPGVTAYAYGDSWTALDTNNTVGMRAIIQFATALGLTLDNRALSGYLAGDIAAVAIGVNPVPAATTGLAVLAGVGLNDLSHTDTAAQRTATLNYLRALFAAASADQRIEETAFTYGPNWDTVTGSLFSGGAVSRTHTDGATATYTIATPGTYYFLSIGRTTGAGVITISQGATTLAVLECNAQHVDTGHAVNSGFGPLSVRLPSVAAGTLTITYSTAGRTGTIEGYPDALLRIPSSPRTVLAVKPVHVTSATWDKPSFLAYIRDSYDVVAAELGAHVVVCDPAPGWNPGP